MSLVSSSVRIINSAVISILECVFGVHISLDYLSTSWIIASQSIIYYRQ